MSPNNKTPFKVYLLLTAMSGPARLPAEGWPKTMIPTSAGGDPHPKGLPSSPGHKQNWKLRNEHGANFDIQLLMVSGTGSSWQHVGPCSPFLQPGDCGGVSFPHWRRTPVGDAGDAGWSAPGCSGSGKPALGHPRSSDKVLVGRGSRQGYCPPRATLALATSS